MDQDANNDTMMVNGGRAYFEAYSLADGMSSYTYKGFFDQKDYKEPTSKSYQSKQVVKWLIIGGSIVLAVGGIIFLCFCQKKKKKVTSHME
jgi:hypothetical protein